MIKKKILINASNLHVGGGVQVAASFLSELSKIVSSLSTCELVIYASSAVDENIISTEIKKEKFKDYRILNVRGLAALKPNIGKYFEGFDLVFTIFGPLYLSKRIKNHIIGFAQLWILYPNNEVIEKQAFKNRFKTTLKFLIQWLFFKHSAAHLVVELPHVKDRLISFKKYPASRISVVNNCVSSIYLNHATRQKFTFDSKTDQETIKIGYLSRAYQHKNIEVLLGVAREISNISSLKFQFFVTLNIDEWTSFSPEFRSLIVNIGPLTVAQCPSFYQSMDGVVFTSLLECFSATPLEAMAMRKPLFASDRNFVRDCCGEHAVYIDPVNPKDIAMKIHSWFADMSTQDKAAHIEQAYQHILGLPTSKDRALDYIKIINHQLNSASA